MPNAKCINAKCQMHTCQMPNAQMHKYTMPKRHMPKGQQYLKQNSTNLYRLLSASQTLRLERESTATECAAPVGCSTVAISAQKLRDAARISRVCHGKRGRSALANSTHIRIQIPKKDEGIGVELVCQSAHLFEASSSRDHVVAQAAEPWRHRNTWGHTHTHTKFGSGKYWKRYLLLRERHLWHCNSTLPR